MNNYLVLNQVFQEEITTTCGIRNRTLTGSFLVEYHNCTITINGTMFSSEETLKRELFQVLSLDGLNIEIHSIEPVIDFERLSIKNRHHWMPSPERRATYHAPRLAYPVSAL